MGVYLYPSNTETPIKEAYIGIPSPTSIVLDKSSISLTTIGQTEQLTATIEPTVSDHSITWSSDDTTVATVDTSGLVTCVNPGSCTITATTVNGLTATCGVTDQSGWIPGVNTLAYYPLETDTNDYSGNNRHGTNSNVTFSGGIATFNGSNAMVTIADDSWNRPTANFTVLAWAKATSWTHTESGESYVIVAKQKYYAPGYSYCYYSLQINNSQKVFGGFCTGTNYTTYPGESNTTINLNEWNLYTTTNDGTTKTLYLNGIQIGQATASTTTATTPVPLTIGNTSRYNHDGYFNGNISKVILEDKTRTQQEIQDFFNQTKTIYGIS